MEDIYQMITQSLGTLYSPEETESLKRRILEHVSGKPYYQIREETLLFAQPATERKIREILDRLLQSEPLQYILGETFFYGFTFHVNRSTLIPRPETEELVERIIADYKKHPPRSVLDIGTGSGCIAISLAKHLAGSQITGIDISSEALKIARENAERLGATHTEFLEADILSVTDPSVFRTIPFDCIVSNPPYVMEKEKALMDRNVLNYEPPNALFVPDSDPLLFYRQIARLGKEWLPAEGSIYFEINAQCGPEMIAMMQEEGYTSVQLFRDLSGNDRIIKARL